MRNHCGTTFPRGFGPLGRWLVASFRCHLSGYDGAMARSKLARSSAPPPVFALLGGRKNLGAPPVFEHALVDVIRRGIPASALVHAKTALGLRWRDCASVFGVTARTLQRWAPRRLDAPQSERLLRLSRIATHAWSVFGDRGAAVDWLKTPSVALEGQTPLARLDTDAGTSQVVELLERKSLSF